MDTLDLRWNAPLADGRTITRFLQICLAGEEIEDEDCTATYQPVPNSVRLIEDVLREEDELHVVFTLRRQP